MKIGSCHRSQEYLANNKNELVTGNKIETFGAISNNNITNLLGIMGWKSSDVVRFVFGPLLQGQMWTAKFKSAYNLLIIGPRGCNVKPTYWESWGGNLLMWSDLTLDPSFKVNLRGQPNLKVLITCSLLVLEVCDVKPTNRKSWAGNLLMCSDLTLDPSFRVKRG